MENFTSSFEQTFKIGDKKIIISNKKVKILQMLVDDINRKIIADKLNITISAVDASIQFMKKKVNCESVYALIGIMFREGILK
jgi:DNA-binding NarL/FixJ family response regulator